MYDTQLPSHRFKQFNSMIEQMRKEISSQNDLQFNILEMFTEKELSLFDQLFRYNGLILTGSPLNLSELNDPKNPKWTAFQRKKIAAIEAFIRQYRKPILGICFGHQLLAHCFDPRYIRRMQSPRFNSEAYSGDPRIRTIDIGPGFGLLSAGSYQVELIHNDEVRNSNWAVTDPAYDDWTQNRKISEFSIPPFTVHGLSAEPAVCCIQAIRHESLPYYGVQFHPEFNFDPRREFQSLVKQLRDSGKTLFRNFIQLVLSQ